MSVHRSFSAALIFSICLAACVTHGGKFDSQLVNQLKPGVSTTQDATRLLGPPRAESNYPNGTRLLQWQYTQGSLVGGSGAHVAILFDKDGRMVQVTHKYDSQGQ